MHTVQCRTPSAHILLQIVCLAREATKMEERAAQTFVISCKGQIGSQSIIDQLMRLRLYGHNVVEF